MSIKTSKSLLKRIKITGSGKVMKRPPHQNHFNSKDSGNMTRRKRGYISVSTELARKAKFLIPYIDITL